MACQQKTRIIGYVSRHALFVRSKNQKRHFVSCLQKNHNIMYNPSIMRKQQLHNSVTALFLLLFIGLLDHVPFCTQALIIPKSLHHHHCHQEQQLLLLQQQQRERQAIVVMTEWQKYEFGRKHRDTMCLHMTMMDGCLVEVVTATPALLDSTDGVAASAMTTTTTLKSLGALITEWAEQGGPTAMSMAVAISDAVPLLPTQPISVLAGALFGFQTGLLVVVLGQSLATIFALVVGRQLGSNILAILGRDNSDKIKKVLEQLGLDSTADYKKVFTTILVARQSPVLPFSLGNYMVGAVTSGT